MSNAWRWTLFDLAANNVYADEMSAISFKEIKKLPGKLGRVGEIHTPHGIIKTPAFIVVGTKATVKALTIEQLKSLNVQSVLANTYHLYLEPGDEIVKEAGGLHTFMNWDGPSWTDSGGFQVFSLGDAYDKKDSKFAHEMPEDDRPTVYDKNFSLEQARLARIDEEGVTFTSHLDGSVHRFTAEKSIEIQHNIGADIMFAFDECTSPVAPHQYQKEASARTHRWADRSLKAHRQNTEAQSKQGLFGVIQGGRYQDLRKESAEYLANLPFDGYGIGGSFTKRDLDDALQLVNSILPNDKPRHLLGIGEPLDLFDGIEYGADTFDCVSPTRLGRTGTLYTKRGKINIINSKYIRDFSPIEEDCDCYTCQNFTKAYVAHLFRSKEMLGATLASIHNLHFILRLVENIRQAMLDDRFTAYKEEFMRLYTV